MKEILHAVLAGSLYYSIPDAAGKHRMFTIDIETSNDVSTLVEIMQKYKIDTVWIVPGSPAAYWTIENLGDLQAYNTSVSTSKNGEAARFLKHITLFKHEGTWEEKRTLTVTWPERTPYQWRPSKVPECTQPIACLAAIHYVEKALGTPIDTNPGVTGRSILQSTNDTPGRRSWLDKPGYDLKTLPTQVGYDLDYLRTIEDPARVGVGDGYYVVAWDKNSQHLAASSSILLGVGTPVNLSYGKFTTIEDLREKNNILNLPGYWKIQVNEGDLPAIQPLMRDPLGRLQEWVTTPTLRLLNEMCIFTHVSQSINWPLGKRVFDKTATTIWQARESLASPAASYPHTEGRLLAYYSMKRIATATVGLLANPIAAKYKPQWFRPDWRATIIEEAKARFIRQIIDVYVAYHVWPICITVDKVYYHIRVSSPDLARFPGHFEKTGLGGWKLAACLPASMEVMQAFAPKDDEGNPNNAAYADSVIKKIVASKG